MSALLLLALLAQPSAKLADSLAECRRLDQSFDTKGMPGPCTAAVDDATRPVADRADAARLLAFALFTNGDVDGAESAFLRMLAMLPTATVGEGASPRLLEVFGRARASFDADVVTVTAVATTPPPPATSPDATSPDAGGTVAFSATVTDALGRVARVRASLLAGGREVASAALQPAGPGTWQGATAAPADAADGCRVEALGLDGSVVASGTCQPPAAATTADDGPPWLLIGAGAGAVVVVAASVALIALAVSSNPPPGAVTVVIE